MLAIRKNIFIALLIAVFSIQLGVAGTSAASELAPQGTPGDLSIAIQPAAQERAFGALICNHGTDDVIGFTLDREFVNYDASTQLALPATFVGSNPTNSGTFDATTGSWEGLIQTDECVAIGFIGEVTGNFGESIEVTLTITSSTLGDSTPNVDPNPANDVAHVTTSPLSPDGDIALATRLLTTGEIQAGDTVEYELTISNVGAGDYVESDENPLGVYFVLPEGTSFISITDLDEDDPYNLVEGTCASLGDVGVFLPTFADYNAELAGCQFRSETGIVPSGDVMKFIYTMTASGPFSTGETKVLALVNADDADSIALQVYMYTPGTNPFEFESNNTNMLVYDGNELNATINRCAGVGEVVKINDACFTVTFNKPIYEPSFTQDKLVLTGGGSIYSFVKTGANEWTVRINGMTPNGTVTLSIVEAGVQDLSAVLNSAEVLGINTVRYEVTSDEPQESTGGTNDAGQSGSLAGSLPTTGADLVWQLALSLLVMGAGLTLGSKQKLIPVRSKY